MKTASTVALIFCLAGEAVSFGQAVRHLVLPRPAEVSLIQTTFHGSNQHSANAETHDFGDGLLPAGGRKGSRLLPGKYNIGTTVFWVGEQATEGNPVSNLEREWEYWVIHFGGEDAPTNRNNFTAVGFTPKQNPFYVALPYNDVRSTYEVRSR